MSRFDLVAVVDWSASSARPRTRPQADAIWVGLASAPGIITTYHPSRHAAELALNRMIDAALSQNQRLLIGFDFPMGYPDGFAARLTGHASAPAVWDWLNHHITDGPLNRNNRFAVADQINQTFNADQTLGGPFWGRPESQPFPHLPARKTVDYPSLNLAERRRVEQVVRSAQPVWKLYTTGAAGSQSLTGLPLIHRLSQRPQVSVWPFQPATQVTLAEVYPSLLAPAVTATLTAANGPVSARANAPRAIKDEVQVRLLSRALHSLSQAGALTAFLNDPPPEARSEEGWILGAGHAAALLAAL